MLVEALGADRPHPSLPLPGVRFVSLASTAGEDDVGLEEGEGAQPLAGLVWVGQHEAQAYRVNLALRQDQDAVGGHFIEVPPRRFRTTFVLDEIAMLRLQQRSSAAARRLT